MSFVFSRLLPVAVLIAAKISIEGFIQSDLENACFSLPSSTSPDENNIDNGISTLCKWFSMITIDEGKSPHGHQNSAASIAEFPFGMVRFAIDSTTKLFSLNSKAANNSIPFFPGDFFKYEEISTYLDFYITAMLILTTIFAATSSSSAGILSYASKLLPLGKKTKKSEEEENNKANDESPSFIINILPLTFWCLVGSHTINRKTSSYLVENNNNNNTGIEDVLQQQYFSYSSTLMLAAVSLIVQNLTTFSTNSILSRICGFIIWTFFLASGAMVENALLWFSVSFFLFLNIFSPLASNINTTSNRSRLFAIRRFIACTFALFVAGFCFAIIHYEFFATKNATEQSQEEDVSSSSSSSPSHGAFSPLVFVASRLRNYGAGLDVGHREARWFPGSIVGELLVYGFRGPAPAIVVAQTLVPWILTVIVAMRLKMKFETVCWICALCDHREATVLGHFAVGALLAINQLKASRNKSRQQSRQQQQHQQQQRPAVYGPLILTLATLELFSFCMMICYFAAWCLYRSAQQNMSFYALVLGHLLLTLRLILDHEAEEAEAA